MGDLKKLSTNWPIAAGMIILLLALLLRINDIFLLQLDQAWGDILLSKGLGFILVLVYVLLVNNSLWDIGLHTEDFGLNLMLGFTTFCGIYLFAYGLEYGLLLWTGNEPQLIIKAISFKPGAEGGFWFITLIIFSNSITSWLEEGLFRGLLLSKFLTKFSFWAANALQAVLFGLWYLVWPIKELVSGQIAGQAVVFTGSMLLIMTTINGFIWGYMYLKTNSLWASWMGNTVTNTILNLVHIKSQFGLDTMMVLRGTGAIVLGVISMVIIKYVADEFKLEETKAW